MGSIVVFENISLDGVIQDPTGEEGFSPQDWRAGLPATDRQEWDKLLLHDALGAQVLLLGRHSYEFFATRYPQRAGELADQMNTLPKFVASATLADPGWSNSTILKGDIVDEVFKLKHKIDGEIRIYASSQLVHKLIEHDLVDELRLVIFPLVMGSGSRLFDHVSNPKAVRALTLRLAGTRTIGNSLSYLTYTRVPVTANTTR